jgi:hypothetical protein
MLEFFKDSEIIGLDIKLAKMLDMARKMAGMRFIITSGRRTPEQSVAVGGFATDSHTKGLAADIACKDDAEAWSIIHGAYVAGFTRIGRGKGHIHLDIDPSLPQNVFWVEKAYAETL